jgi:hypothetical protein
LTPSTPPPHRLLVGTSLATLIASLAASAWVAAHWRRMLQWGATDAEATEWITGDDIVDTPKYRSTHAVTIQAPVRAVWPWLVQMGQGRGGLYSYDWLENLVGCHIHSIDRVDPDLQHLAVGDIVRMVPEGTQPPLRFAVATITAPYLLVLGPPQTRAAAYAAHVPYPSWTFRLEPVGPERCRLVVRFQNDFAPSPLASMSNKYALAPIHLLMERKMMLGIKRRAERTT